MFFVRTFLATVLATAAMIPADLQASPFVRFSSLTIEDGLAQNSVNVVFQDSRGLIWIGTEEGLHRYDGYGFRIYRGAGESGPRLSNGFINAIAEDAQGGLWIGTNHGGVNRLDPERQAISHFSVDYGSAPARSGDDRIRTLAVTPGETVWAGTDSGLLQRKPNEAVFRPVTFTEPADSGGSEDVVMSMALDADGRLLLGGSFGFRIGQVESSGDHAWSTPAAMPSEQLVSAITAADDGGFWIAGPGFLAHWDAETGLEPMDTESRWGFSMPDHRIADMAVGREGRLWISVYGDSLWLLDPANGDRRVFTPDPARAGSLADHRITDLMVDRSGLLWLGTKWHGAQRLNPRALDFGYYGAHPVDSASLPDPVVWALHSDERGRLWIGTEGGLARLSTDGRIERIPFAPDTPGLDRVPTRFVIRIFIDSGGRVWVGTLGGLARLESDGYLHRVSLADDLGVDPEPGQWAGVTGFAESDDGRLWMAMLEGLAVRDPETGTWSWVLGKERETSTLPLRGVRLGPDERLWLNSETGLYVYDPVSDRIVRRISDEPTADQHLDVSVVTDFFGLGTDTLWLATPEGFYKLDESGRQPPQRMNDAFGLPGSAVWSITEDKNGALWLGSSQGLIRFAPGSGGLIGFDIQDGLQSNEFNVGAGTRLPDGRIAVGGIDGFNVFQPEAVLTESPAPEVMITDVLVMNEPRALSRTESGDLGAIELDHRESVLTFQFAVLDYAVPEENRFEYKLVGFDEGWQSGGSYNRATYTNLPAGEYVFQVRGANSTGQWSETAARTRVVIQPAPWRTLPAYTAYAITVLLLVAAGSHQLRQRRRRAEALRRETDRRRWAERLHRLTARLATSLDAETIMQQLFASLATLVHIRQAAVFLEGPQGLECIGSKGGDDDGFLALPQTHPDDVERCRRSRAGIDLGQEALNSLRLGSSSEPVHVAMVPLEVSGIGFGLIVSMREGSPFRYQERRLMGTAATQALLAFDKARLFAKVERLAMTDSLTGLYNRRHFEMLAGNELARSYRYQRGLAVLYLDIDHFKAINDHYGHEAGDSCLKELARLLQASLRDADVVARQGGEEFVVLLPEAEPPCALKVAERIRRTVEAAKLSALGGAHMTVSIGMTNLDSRNADLDQLLREADGALYKAKTQGRNRVVVAEPGV